MGKRKNTDISEYEDIILSMRHASYTQREIADESGLTIKLMESWITHYNKR